MGRQQCDFGVSPKDYVPDYESRFSDGDLSKMYYWHAMLVGWYQIDYVDFLMARRKLISKVIQDGYRKFESKSHKEPETGKVAVDKIITQGEGSGIEFKSTLLVNLHIKQNNVKVCSIQF